MGRMKLALVAYAADFLRMLETLRVMAPHASIALFIQKTI